MSIVKTPKEIEGIKKSAAVLKKIFNIIPSLLLPGVRSDSIESSVRQVIFEEKASAANYEVENYPYATSLSINDEIAHGLPVASKLLRYGDIVSVDVAVCKDGLYSDCAYTYPLQGASKDDISLINLCRESLLKSVLPLKKGMFLSEYGKRVESLVKEKGASVFPQLVGHGIGRFYHEEPKVFNFYHENNDIVLEEGMIFAFELMITKGSTKCYIDDDSFTIRSEDGSNSAHFEHTVLIGERGAEILV